MLERRCGWLQAAVQSAMPYFFARNCCRDLGSGAVSSCQVSNCSRQRRTQLLTARMTEYQIFDEVRPSGIAKDAERAARRVGREHAANQLITRNGIAGSRQFSRIENLLEVPIPLNHSRRGRLKIRLCQFRLDH